MHAVVLYTTDHLRTISGNFFLYLNRDCIINSDVTCNRIFNQVPYVRDHAARIFGLDGNYDRLSEEIQESPADARVARDSSACIPPSWIFEISKWHH